MRQLVLPGDLRDASDFELDRKTSRYLLRVLRMMVGEVFDGIDGTGSRYLCTLIDASADAARTSLKPKAVIVPAGGETGTALPRIALIQALPKGQKMDLIVRQAAEMGIEVIVPIETRNCVSREPLEADRKAKLERRIKIVREAGQQSGSPVLTKVLPTVNPAALGQILREIGFSGPESLCLICHEAAQSEMLDLHTYLGRNPGTIAVLVGPEGGFTPEETLQFVTMGFRPVHFGGTILRTETAAAYALAAVRTITMERNSWNPSN